MIQAVAPHRDVCQPGGLAGLVLWFYCNDVHGSGDAAKKFHEVEVAIDIDSPAADPEADCPWIGYPNTSLGCPVMKSTCGSFPNSTFPACGKGASAEKVTDDAIEEK